MNWFTTDKIFNEFSSNSDENSLNDSWKKVLKYYQYLVKEIVSSSDFNETEYARGLLIYHTIC